MSTINVLRYSLLGVGVAYGAFHRYNLERLAKKDAAAALWKQQERLIRVAKQEFSSLRKKTDSGSTLIDWEDPNLDLDSVFASMG